MHKRLREARCHRLRIDKAKRRQAIVVCDAMLRVVGGAFAFESARIRRLSKDDGDSFEMREKFPRRHRFVRAADGNRHDRDWETASLGRWKVAGR
jgi:hypothetical protein